MHDIRYIREHPEAFDAGLARRYLPPSSKYIVNTDKEQRKLRERVEYYRAERKRLSAEYGSYASRGEASSANAQGFKGLLDQNAGWLRQAELTFAETENVEEFLQTLPNIPAPEVPEGRDEAGNVEIARWGTPRSFAFTPREHADIGPALGLDFETGAAISGARFTFLRGQMARLQRGLGQFMLDTQVAAGFTECAPPLLVWDKALFGTGQLPKFAEDLYSVITEYSNLQQQFKYLSIANQILAGENDFLSFLNEELDKFSNHQISMGRDMSQLSQLFTSLSHQFLVKEKVFSDFSINFAEIEGRLAKMANAGSAHAHYLIPTAEVSLTNSVREQILAARTLPIRMTALTPCFRSEAGAAGKDTRGYIRQHQFEKVELVTVCHPKDSGAQHEAMTKAAEAILEALDLPYRRMLLCAGDMGFTARKTYDLEVWLPGQDAYREISSVSNCGDFQARRMNTRFRPEGEKATQFVHTLNGSGLAVGRTLVAVLENYQNEDGSVDVPAALIPYMGGLTRLVPA